MNSTQEKVSGEVEFVGTKFNGSVKVNGTYYSNAKGFKNPAKKGDNVTLTLTSWESKGKSGFNVTAVDIVPMTKAVEEPKANESVADQIKRQEPRLSGRDFDAENRGKVRHGLVVALLPLVAQEVITAGVARALVTEFVDFVMKGE